MCIIVDFENIVSTCLPISMIRYGVAKTPFSNWNTCWFLFEFVTLLSNFIAHNIQRKTIRQKLNWAWDNFVVHVQCFPCASQCHRHQWISQPKICDLNGQNTHKHNVIKIVLFSKCLSINNHYYFDHISSEILQQIIAL